jgi:hypothetical protein
MPSFQLINYDVGYAVKLADTNEELPFKLFYLYGSEVL